MNHHLTSTSRRAAVLTLVLILASILNGCGDDNTLNQTNIGTEDNPITEINFGVVSMESNTGLKVGYAPFFEDMSEELGVKVNGFFAPDYAGIIEGMRFGKVDVAWFGNKSGMEAVDRANGEVFAHTTDKDGTEGYQSVIIVHRDSDIQTVDDLIERGSELNFGNGDPHSTSGYLIPQHYLWGPRGVDPPTHFKRMINANHEANLIAVTNGQVDLATNNTLNLAKFAKVKPEIAEQVRVIWKSPLIPPDPLIYRKDLPEPTKQAIRDFILSYGLEGDDAAEEKQILANMSVGWGTFKPSDNNHLIPIREISIAKKIMEIKNNDTLDDADKAQQIKPLQEQLKQIRKAAENADQDLMDRR